MNETDNSRLPRAYSPVVMAAKTDDINKSGKGNWELRGGERLNKWGGQGRPHREVALWEGSRQRPMPLGSGQCKDLLLILVRLSRVCQQWTGFWKEREMVPEQGEVVTSVFSTGVVVPELCAGVSDWIWGVDTGWREGACVLST